MSKPAEKQGAFSARVEEVLDEDFRIATTRSCKLDWEENDKKFQLLDSDSDVNTEDKADMYYQALRERDHLSKKEGPFLVAEYEDHKVEVNLALIPKYLAMVMAKITATISGRRSVEILLDSSSELNIMAQEIQEDLRLPLDPSGASWSLCGIAGQPVNLVGLCRNVQVEIGGFLFPHNFFISKDTLGKKDIIIGQPWLLNQAAQFNYLPETGMTVQFWERGDQEGNSVLINVPLIKLSRNVFRAFAKEPRARFCVANISYASCAVAETNPFTVRTHNGITWTPASPSYNAKIGKAPVIPRLGNSMINSFNDPEIEKFGPWSSKLDFINKYVTLNDPIYDALRQIWHANHSSPSDPSITD